MQHTVQVLHHHLMHIGSRLRAGRAALSGVSIGPGVLIAPGSEVALGPAPSRRGTIVLGERSQVGRGALLHPYGGRIETGRETYIGPYSILYGHGGLTLGSHVLIGPHCQLFSSNHAIPPANRLIVYEPDILAPTRIGSDVWLGAGVIVLAGVTIGDGCVIGAGSVVTRDLPPHSTAYGVPATLRDHRLPS